MMWYLVPGKVLNTSASDQNNGVLLQIVAFTGNVAGYFDSVGKTYSGDLSKSGVRLFRSRCLNSCAHASFCGEEVSVAFL